MTDGFWSDSFLKTDVQQNVVLNEPCVKPKAVFALDKIVCNGNGGATGERSCTGGLCRGDLR